MKILFVCTGNICRSPMAEALLRHALTEVGIEGIEVASAGTWGNDGWTASDPAVHVLAQRGVDLSGHVARSLRAEDIEEADLILVMTAHHARDVVRLHPGAEAKTRYLKELSELTPADLDPASTPDRRLAALLEVTRPPYRRDLELDDPYGLPVGVYERTAAEIERHVAKVVEILTGKAGAGQAGP
ncbi:MAG: low molecular weight protein arginine phosphatase [Actinomycetota bacterium]